MENFLVSLIGEGSKEVLWWQMLIRGFIMFVLTVIMVRIGGKRIFGKNTAFDFVLAIIFGSIVSRGITGNAPFLSTLLTAFLLVLMHRAMAFLAFRYSKFGNLIKGKRRLLIDEGVVLKDKMEKSQITTQDLEEAVRMKGEKDNLDKIRQANLERSGEISLVLNSEEKEG